MANRINRDRAHTEQHKPQGHPLVEFINKNANLLTWIVGGILVVFTGLTILRTINNNREAEATAIYDAAMVNFQMVQYLTNQQEQQQFLGQQYNNLDKMVKDFPRTLAAARARLFFGQAYYQQANQSGDVQLLKKAEETYLEAIASTGSPFYKTVAILGLAQTYEQQQQFAQAFDQYQRVVTQYPDQGFSPTALIGMARCKEMLRDTAQARSIYQQVADQYPDSQWARYAQGKVYYYNETGVSQPGSLNTGTNMGIMPLQ